MCIYKGGVQGITHNFYSGKVKKKITYTNGSTCVVYGEIEAGQTLSKRLHLDSCEEVRRSSEWALYLYGRVSMAG